MADERTDEQIESAGDVVDSSLLSVIGDRNGITVYHVEKGSDLGKQNFEDVTWYKRLYPLRKLGMSNIFNIYPDFTITETTANKKVISDNSIESVLGDTNKTNNYYALFMASDINIVFAAITLSGELYFIKESLDLIESSSSREVLEEIIEKTCKYSSKISNISQRNINGTDIIKSDLISYLLVDLCIKLGSGFFDFDHNVQRLGYIINDAMKSLFRDESNDPVMFNLLLNQNDMYRTTINKFMANQEQIERKAMERGILIGSKFFTGFQRAGYIYDIDTGRWEKKVDIHPEFCVWGDILYKIPEKFRDKFYIETLSFDPNTLREESFILSARGKHPNVSGSGQACIGSELCDEFTRLIRNKGLMTQEYVNFLIRIEEALKIINFDSSYYDYKSATGVNPSNSLVKADVCNTEGTTIKGTLRRV